LSAAKTMASHAEHCSSTSFKCFCLLTHCVNTTDCEPHYESQSKKFSRQWRM